MGNGPCRPSQHWHIGDAGKVVWVQEVVGSNLAAAKSGHENPCGKGTSPGREIRALNFWFINVGFLLSHVPQSIVFEMILDHIDRFYFNNYEFIVVSWKKKV